ncbi:MAG: translation initiation factor IF-3 [Candidatus Edwardsbacteria bacterium]
MKKNIIKKKLRVNYQIRVPQVRVIDPEGKQIGVIPTAEALRLAQQKKLDLVEISPQARPPVCKILDYGKYLYEEEKKWREAKKKQHEIKIKGIRIRPKIGEHDYQVKLSQAKNFLEQRDKVKVTMEFHGREIAHIELGEKVLNRFVKDLEAMATVEQPKRREGRNIVVLFAPK